MGKRMGSGYAPSALFCCISSSKRMRELMVSLDGSLHDEDV